MVNFVNTILVSSISTIFGFAITVFISYFAITNLSLFWSLSVILWIIIGIIDGIVLKSWKECLIASGVTGFISLMILFFAFILLGLFSDLVIDIFHIANLFTPEKIITFSIFYSFLCSIIILSLIVIFSLISRFSRNYFTQSQSLHGLDQLESEEYQKYESSQNGQLNLKSKREED